MRRKRGGGGEEEEVEEEEEYPLLYRFHSELTTLLQCKV